MLNVQMTIFVNETDHHRYNWNFAEIGVNHHQTNKQKFLQSASDL
jgi:hypothetical protein